MKLSKVQHASAGIGQEHSKGRGMLYSNPARKNESAIINLSKRVEELNRTAKRLFSIFNEVDEYRLFCPSIEDKKLWNKAVKNFGYVLLEILKLQDTATQLRFIHSFPKQEIHTDKDVITKKYVLKKGSEMGVLNVSEKKPSEKEKPAVGSLAALLQNAGYDVEIKDKDDKSDLFASFSQETLRKPFMRNVKTKSGKKVYLKDIVDGFLYAVADAGHYEEHMKKITDEELVCLLKVLDETYNRTKQLEDAISSIETNDTRVQVVSEGDKARLAISSYINTNSKKGMRKRALFEFMIAYSDADDAGRKMLRDEKKAFIKDYLTSGDSDGVVFSVAIEEKLKYVSSIKKNIEDEKDDDAKKQLRAEFRQINAEIEDLLGDEMRVKYNENKVEPTEDVQRAYWLNFFEEETQRWVKSEIRRRLGVNNSPDHRRLILSDLSNHLFKYWISFVAQKYIELGKGVFHFTNFEKETQGGVIGEVLPTYQKGLTSFDYERIAAEDGLKKDLATYVSFAVNNFATSAFSLDLLAELNEDALSYRHTSGISSTAKRDILRYFGGISKWEALSDIDDKKLTTMVRNHMASIRNNVVHYDADYTDTNITEKEQKLAMRLFNIEYERLGKVYAAKYYSNNVPMFYSSSDIQNLMNRLYAGKRAQTAGVPAFNRIVAPSAVDRFLAPWKANTTKVYAVDPELSKKYRSAIFFALKEIYYYGFLTDEKLQLFLDTSKDKLREKPSDLNIKPTEYSRAYENYADRYEALKESGRDAIGICEQLMYDYAIQNDSEMHVKTTAGKKKDGKEEIYGHFRMMLYRQIKTAFAMYLDSKSEYAFLKNPEDRREQFNNLTVEKFTGTVKVESYTKAKEAVEKDSINLAWYITAHFMSKKQINLLAGSIRSYMRYVKSISLRTRSTGNPMDEGVIIKADQYVDLLAVLEFTMNFCDVYTIEVKDYFDNEAAYMDELGNYIDLRNMKPHQKEVICNPNNITLNRNAVRATMYGKNRLFSANVLHKVDGEDVDEYTRLMSSLAEVFQTGKCKDEKQQKALRSFQSYKNRVELTNISAYVDIINDMYGQLSAWCYMRERDLTYMQLGFYYTKLFWGNSVKEMAPERKLSDAAGFKDGAILYMIRLMYSFDLENPRGGGKYKVGQFINEFGVNAYIAGLELFEDVDRLHDEEHALRSYIDHFKYFSKMDHSIEELYGDIFTGFFSYSNNLHRSVPLVYQNILATHKIIAKIEMKESDSKWHHAETKVGYPKVKPSIMKDVETRGKDGNTKIKYNASSDMLTFKINGKLIELDAHDRQFIEDVKQLLKYKK